MLALVLSACSGALEPLEADPAVVARVATLLCPAPNYALSDLLAWQRRSHSQAVVTSGFYAARGVSRYRSQPGLHLGYDIAMPAGAPALAAWPGRVVAVIPWTDGEWGIVVEHPDGTRATYGHLVPQVGPGVAVEAGMALGTVAVDHVDVKMRDARGVPLDFGAGTGGPGRERLLADWWLSRLAQRDTDEARRQAAGRRVTLERRSARRAQAEELGLWTPAQASNLERELRKARQEARSVSPSRLAETRARQAGLTWNEVRSLARRWGELHPELSRRLPAARSSARKPLGSWR